MVEASRSYRTDTKEHTNTCSHIFRAPRLKRCLALNLLLEIIKRRYPTSTRTEHRHRHRGNLQPRKEGDGVERLSLPVGYMLGRDQQVQDVLAMEAELLRSEGIDPAWPGAMRTPSPIPTLSALVVSWAQTTNAAVDPTGRAVLVSS